MSRICHAFFGRHPPHKGNIVSPEDLQLQFQRGQGLVRWCAEHSIPLPSGWGTSPQFRAVDGGSAVVRGIGQGIPLLGVYEDLGALTDGQFAYTDDEAKTLTAEAKTNGRSLEAQIFADEATAEKLRRRAKAGAWAVGEMIAKLGSKGVDVVSGFISGHGGRHEAVLAALANVEFQPAPPFLMQTGDIAHISVAMDEGKITGFSHLKNLGDLAKYGL